MSYENYIYTFCFLFNHIQHCINYTFCSENLAMVRNSLLVI